MIATVFENPYKIQQFQVAPPHVLTASSIIIVIICMHVTGYCLKPSNINNTLNVVVLVHVYSTIISHQNTLIKHSPINGDCLIRKYSAF